MILYFSRFQFPVMSRRNLDGPDKESDEFKELELEIQYVQISCERVKIEGNQL